MSLAGDEVFLTLLPVVVLQDGDGVEEEFNVNPPGALAELVALVDPRAFAVAGVIVTSSCAGIESLDEFVLEISRKLAVVVAGSRRAITVDSAPFRWSIESGTPNVLCSGICGRARPFGSFTAVGNRRSVHSGRKSSLRGSARTSCS